MRSLCLGMLLVVSLLWGACGTQKAMNSGQALSKSQQDLHDIWALQSLEGMALDAEARSGSPYLELNLSTHRLMGNDGCNEFRADIEKVGSKRLRFGPLLSTKKYCPQAKLAERFVQSLAATRSYQRKGLELFFFDATGKQLLSLRKVD
jgi:heat shock protein HslJ